MTHLTHGKDSFEVSVIPPDFDAIPTALQVLPWALWRAEQPLNNNGSPQLKPNGKPRINKAPTNGAGYKISKSQPQKWLSYSAVQTSFHPEGFSGVGVLLQASSGLVGIDLDDLEELVQNEPEVDRLLAQSEEAGIYCERSPSGNGLRLFVFGVLPEHAGRRKGGIELYSDAAFLTVTGAQEWSGQVQEAQWLVDKFLALLPEHVRTEAKPEHRSGLQGSHSQTADSEALARWAEEQHPLLWAGDWASTKNPFAKSYPSQSEADMALCSFLMREASSMGIDSEAFEDVVWTTFQASGLYRPEKTAQVRNYAIPKVRASLPARHQSLTELNKLSEQTINLMPDSHADVRNGKMFAAMWMNRFKFVSGAQKWLVWGDQ